MTQRIADGEITRLRADLAKVTWERNEAQAGLAAMTKSRDAAMRIVTAKDQQMSVLRTQQDQWSEARNTLESERAANARITADLAASQAECDAAVEQLRTELAVSREREVRMRGALRNLLALDADHQRGADDEDVCAEVREARAALAEGAQEPVHRPVHQPVHGALNNEA